MVQQTFHLVSDGGAAGWLYEPITTTLLEGIDSLLGSERWRINRVRCWHRCLNVTYTAPIAGDIFCFIGIANMLGFMAPERCDSGRCNDVPWRQLLSRGVFTVWIQTEPLEATCMRLAGCDLSKACHSLDLDCSAEPHQHL